MSKLEKVLQVILVIITGAFLGFGSAGGVNWLLDKDNYAISSKVDDNLSKMRDETASLEMQLRLRINELEKQINCLKKPTYEILVGKFVGVNVRENVGYIVVDINGEEIETIGLDDFTFIMNEYVFVIVFDGYKYSIPIRLEAKE